MECEYCLTQCSIAVKREHDYRDSYKGKHLIGAGLLYKGVVHCHHGGEHCDIQSDMALGKELRVLHPNL